MTLYELLPAFIRERDAEEGSPLRELLGIVGTSAEEVGQDVEQLWNDLFIETCRSWVIPYIGDLVGNDLLHDAGRTAEDATVAELFGDVAGPDLRPPIAVRTRADVAKTIYYRRRKGTLAMLEELARDVTGWPAHAVEFFELLGWTQNLEHVRPQSGWFDIRSIERSERVDGAFDTASHTVDVRPISQADGWHSIKNVGFFLWRLRSYELEDVPARQAGPDWRWHFSPLGNRAPLFARWRREGDETGLATELHVPGPIRRAFFADNAAALYGRFAASPEASLAVTRNGTPIPVAAVVCRRLDPWPAAPPAGAVVAVDVAAGRIAIGAGLTGATNAVDASFHYGFPADLGGGPYERRAWLVRRDGTSAVYEVREGAAAPLHPTVTSALNRWVTDGRPNAVVRILDSRTYALPATIQLRAGGRLAIEAANGERPLLQTRVAAGLEIDADAPPPADPDARGGLTLSGVVVEGWLHVIGDVGRVRLVHATLVPGRRLEEDGDAETSDPSLVAESASGGTTINARLRVEAVFSITGPLVVPAQADGVWILDSIVDGLGGEAIRSAPLQVDRSTILGRVRARELDASESIFTGRIRTVRTQDGCVRFSYVRPGSRTPRRYRCQPDLGIRKALDEALARDPALSPADQDAIRNYVGGWLRPSFVSTRYGEPAYVQLRLAAPVEIRTGAEDGSEMGVYCHVKQPQRESNLRIRLDEYLPFGLEAGVIYVT